MQPNQANIASMGQTARASATLQGNKPGGPLGVLAQTNEGSADARANAGLQAAQQAATNTAGGPGATGIAAGQTTGLIAGQMMTRRI
jgi:hypothetical protein